MASALTLTNLTGDKESGYTATFNVGIDANDTSLGGGGDDKTNSTGGVRADDEDDSTTTLKDNTANTSSSDQRMLRIVTIHATVSGVLGSMPLLVHHVNLAV